MKLKPCPFCKNTNIKKSFVVKNADCLIWPTEFPKVAECERCNIRVPLELWNSAPRPEDLAELAATVHRMETRIKEVGFSTYDDLVLLKEA